MKEMLENILVFVDEKESVVLLLCLINSISNAALKAEASMGRLNINTKMDTDGDGDFDELVSFRSPFFLIWNGNTGEIVFDSKMN
jgi:hypothetical protein